MKRFVITLLILIATRFAYAGSILFDSFEYANQDGQAPNGWVTANDTWLAGYLPKDHNRIAHTGNWYAYTDSNESWMFMQMNMSEQLKYRFSLWAISDGGYQLEIWAGSAAYPSAMTQLLLSDIVNIGGYEHFSAFIDEVAANHEYFGIHAVSAYGDYVLTIDDINVDLVEKYAMQVTPDNMQTSMTPGSEVEFSFKFINVGYEPLNVYITPQTEYFTNIHLYANGVEAPTFPAATDEIVEIRGVATMLPNIAVGSITWIDIMFTLDCGCATAMFTFWATASTDSTEEITAQTSIYPNPSSGTFTIDGNGDIAIFNNLGQLVIRKEIAGKETITLPEGTYFLRKPDGTTEKVVVRP